MEIVLAFLGLSFGITVASGVVAFIISLGIVPRYAGITRTADRIMLYENASIAGAVVGSVLTVFSFSIPVGQMGLLIFGFFPECSWEDG